MNKARRPLAARGAPLTATLSATTAGILVLASALFPTAAAAQGARAEAPKPDTSLIVSTDWLARHLTQDPSVVVLHVERGDSVYRAGHVPGARLVPYAAFVAVVNGIGQELPPPDSLRALFENVGVSNTSHVILTGPPLSVTRAFFTLEYLGLQHVSALDGGVTKWKAEGPRTEGEYLGTILTGNLASKGHLDGARRLEWQDLFRDPAEFAPKSLGELSTLWRERVTPGDAVVTYCLVGYRGSGSYFVSRLLGYPVKLYDGSYDEWSKKDLPVVKTVTPLRVP